MKYNNYERTDKMNLTKIAAILLSTAFVLTSCAAENESEKDKNDRNDIVTQEDVKQNEDVITIKLSDDGVDADSNAVYTANDIVYYQAGTDFTYGEGSEKDGHSKEEADGHTVVHITKPGTYSLEGTLSKGQIAVDLGKDAKKDKDAVVTLILNGVDINCDVAPAVIFYNVYECGNKNEDEATQNVDTEAAGANVIIADGSVNTISGSYVEKIYDPESVVLNEQGTKVEDADKLHKYDAAFYSKMSMNINGGDENSGILNINADSEGLDSELHLTINGGIINIRSGNDGINTNEDNVSVTTVNGGELNITVTGQSGEGDGIDSNGWIVINGGKISVAACSTSMDSGIDADLGISINGGELISMGNMYDHIENGGQSFTVFNLTSPVTAKTPVAIKDADGNTVFEFVPENDFSVVVYSDPTLKDGTYTIWANGEMLNSQQGGGFGRPGMPGGMGHGGGFGSMQPPEPPENGNMQPPEMPDGNMQPPEMPDFSEMQPPEMPNGNMQPPEMPEGEQPPQQ